MTRPILVSSGIGTGPTSLSAFDHALFEAGIANYNLVRLSSVVPLGNAPRVEQVNWNTREHGHLLYVVDSVSHAVNPGQGAAAGLGWVMAKSDPAWGLFVEHAGETEEDVRRKIELSLTRMTSYRTGTAWGEMQSHIVSAACTGEPVCALVVAIYQSKGWDG